MKNDLVASAAFALFLYVCWLRLRVQVYRNRLDRRQYFDPPTGRGPWKTPQPPHREEFFLHRRCAQR